MNDLPEDGNESVIDIFVLSVSDTVIPLFTEHLEKKGYRVTLFTDGSYLLETLRTGKPNLLICDTTTMDDEGFEVCRQIKADDDFWVIPVLILTGASTLTDLLLVLDCNADNFIPHPFDLPYSLSIIESMLGTPVERQTPDQIKTQFKISHDDRIYVVAANRRKLLEFLLSSFEIAVTKSSELSHIKAELQTLSESAIHLEDCITEQTRVIDTIKATLQQKEQKISTLNDDVEEKNKLLAQKADDIFELGRELDSHKILIATHEDTHRTLAQENKDIETSYCAEIETLRRQISELVNELDTTKTSLDTVQTDFEEEKVHCTSLECTLELLVSQKELAETSLRSMTAEQERLKSVLEAEESRATSAEEELKSVIQAKTLSEQESAQIITALTGTKNQQEQDLTRLEGELEEESGRRASAEEELKSVIQAKTLSEQESAQIITALTGTKKQQEQDLTRLEGELEEESGRRASAEEELKSVTQAKTLSEQESAQIITALTGTKNQQEQDLTRLEGELEEESGRRASAEEELKSVIQAKTLSEQESAQTITALTGTKKQQEQDLTRLKGELEEESSRRASAEKQLEILCREKAESESSLGSTITAHKDQLETLQVQLETTHESLRKEQNTTKSLKEKIDEIVTEHEKSLGALTLDYDKLKSAYREEENRAASAEREIETLMQGKTQSEKELSVSIAALTETKQQQDTALIRLKGELEEESSQRIAAENQLGILQLDKEHSESSLRSTIAAHGERLDELQAQLDTTRAALRNEENTTKSLKESLAQALAENEKSEVRVKEDLESYKTTFIRLKRDLDEATSIPKTLERDLDAAKMQNRSLIDELDLANQARAQSVQQVRSLSDQLEEVKAALDAERNLHQAGDRSIEELMQTTQCLEQDLRTTVEERNKLDAILENERKLRLTAEDRMQAAAREQEHLEGELRAISEENKRVEDDRATKIQNLEKEFELVCNLQKSLEEQVNVLTLEKFQAEQKVKSLTDEIDQARNAIAEEWVDHMTCDEPPFAAGEEPEQTQPFPPDEDGGMKNEKCLEIMAKEAELPVIMESASHALTIVSSSETLLSPEPEETVKESSPEFPVSEGGASFPEKNPDHEETVQESGEDRIGKTYGEPVTPVFSFNRKQWFDLLKWAHHTTTLSHDQRLQIVRMGRLIQKDRKLTRKQEDQVKEMITLVQMLGYRPS
jgi:DNA-binding response OmpR family regulator